jgi:hypothetical protein
VPAVNDNRTEETNCIHEYERHEGAPGGYACALCGEPPPVGWYPESPEDSVDLWSGSNDGPNIGYIGGGKKGYV